MQVAICFSNLPIRLLFSSMISSISFLLLSSAISSSLCSYSSSSACTPTLLTPFDSIV